MNCAVVDVRSDCGARLMMPRVVDRQVFMLAASPVNNKWLVQGDEFGTSRETVTYRAHEPFDCFEFCSAFSAQTGEIKAEDVC